MSDVLIAALRDLQWRRRRFAIAAVGTGLVFAMTLVLTGMANGFDVEARRTVDSLGVDMFLVKSGAVGPFLGSAPFTEAELSAADRVPGVQRAVPFVYGSTILSERGATHNVNTFGAPEGGPGMPKMSTGRGPSGPGEIAVSDTMGRKVGEDLEIGSRRLHIVGIVHDSTALAGQPNAFLTVPGAQQLMFSGQPLVSSIGILGKPSQAPEGFRLVDRDGGVQDMVRALQSAKGAIRMMAWFLWVVAALIVGAVIYLSAFERTRDFAVFKAVGVANRSIMSGLALQAVLVALVAAAIGCVLSLAMGPLFPINVVVPMSAFLLLPVVAVVIGLLASLAGLHRAATVDPARAFGGP